MKPGQFISFVIFIAVVCICQWIAFVINNTQLLHLNAFVLSILICCIVFRWPNESWLGSEYAKNCKAKHAISVIGRRIEESDTVDVLSNLKNVDSYFLSSVGENQARSTAADVNSTLIQKFFISLFIAVVISIYGNNEGITGFEFVISAVAIFAPHLWDLSRCEKIRNMNMKLN